MTKSTITPCRSFKRAIFWVRLCQLSFLRFFPGGGVSRALCDERLRARINVRAHARSVVARNRSRKPSAARSCARDETVKHFSQPPADPGSAADRTNASPEGYKERCCLLSLSGGRVSVSICPFPKNPLRRMPIFSKKNGGLTMVQRYIVEPIKNLPVRSGKGFDSVPRWNSQLHRILSRARNLAAYVQVGSSAATLR